MIDFIKENLQENEEILWTGSPQKVQLMENPFKKAIIGQWIVSALMIIFVIYYLATSGDRGLSMMQTGVISILIVLIAIGAFRGPFNVIKKLKTKVLYCITNQRVISVFNTEPIKMHFKTFDSIDEISYEMLPSGCATAYFGKMTPAARGDSRNQSINPAMWGRQLPLMLFSVENIESVLKNLPEQKSAKQVSFS